jgi:hypothetical protein
METLVKLKVLDYLLKPLPPLAPPPVGTSGLKLEPFNEIKMKLVDSTIKQVKSCIAEALKHLDQLENMK